MSNQPHWCLLELCIFLLTIRCVGIEGLILGLILWYFFKIDKKTEISPTPIITRTSTLQITHHNIAPLPPSMTRPYQKPNRYYHCRVFCVFNVFPRITNQRYSDRVCSIYISTKLMTKISTNLKYTHLQEFRFLPHFLLPMSSI